MSTKSEKCDTISLSFAMRSRICKICRICRIQREKVDIGNADIGLRRGTFSTNWLIRSLCARTKVRNSRLFLSSEKKEIEREDRRIFVVRMAFGVCGWCDDVSPRQAENDVVVFYILSKTKKKTTSFSGYAEGRSSTNWLIRSLCARTKT